MKHLLWIGVLGVIGCASSEIEQAVGTYLFESGHQGEKHLPNGNVLLYRRIQLLKDSTFKFVSIDKCDTCDAQLAGAQGRWEMKHDTVILNSSEDIDELMAGIDYGVCPECEITLVLYKDYRYVIIDEGLISDSEEIKLFRVTPIEPLPDHLSK